MDEALKPLLEHGLLGLLVVGLLALLTKVYQRLLNKDDGILIKIGDRHLEFLDKTAAQQERHSDGLEALVLANAKSADGHAKTHDAISHVIEAGRLALLGENEKCIEEMEEAKRRLSSVA